MNEREDRIIYALDFDNEKEARQEIDRTRGAITFYKIGMELFLAAGWSLVDELTAGGIKLMLDLKFLDIPATVGGAVKQLGNHRGISLITVHGHKQTVAAALQARGENKDMKILGVSLLTSFAEEDMHEFGGMSAQELVMLRAKSSLEAGADGLVASAQEAKELRRVFGNDFILVTPGIRLEDDKDDDQKRIATPKEAVMNGADYIVIGRPIRNSVDPTRIVNRIKQQII